MTSTGNVKGMVAYKFKAKKNQQNSCVKTWLQLFRPKKIPEFSRKMKLNRCTKFVNADSNCIFSQYTTLKFFVSWTHRLNCAFAVAGPTMFNTLPDDLRDPAVSTSTFRQSLKTHLFSAYQHVQRIRGVSRNALYKCTILTYLRTCCF